MEQSFLRCSGVLLLLCLVSCTPALKRPLSSVSPAEATRFAAELRLALVQRLGGQSSDPGLQAALDQAAARLLQPPPQIVLVNDASPELMALPDGTVIISHGLLATVADADALAGLLAHAIGHARQHHPLQAVLRITSDSPSAKDSPVASWGAVVSGGVLAAGHNDEEEIAADAAALKLLAAAGIGPQALLQQLGPDSAPGRTLTRHPLSARRLTEAQKMASSLAVKSVAPVDPLLFIAARATLDAQEPGYQLYRQARLTEKAGSLDRALPLYLQAAGQGAEESLLLTGLGMAYLQQNALVAARQHLTRALHVDNNYYYSQLGLGYIALLQGDPDRAVSHLQRSLKLLTTVRTGYLLAEARVARGEIAAAIILYRAVIAADPNGFGRAAQSQLATLEVKP